MGYGVVKTFRSGIAVALLGIGAEPRQTAEVAQSKNGEEQWHFR
jgi:hypothetical protein